MKRILFITNGHGEDIIAAQIIKKLKGKRLKIDVMPVVGKGDSFRNIKVNVIGPKKLLPGGGFGLRNYSYLIKDLLSGLIGKVIAQVKTILSNKGKYDLVIGIGDIVPIIYSILAGCKFIFVGINKSQYYKKLAFNYTFLERLLLKNYCELTLARDVKTARALSSFGIKAKYIGNPMMDAVQNIRVSAHQNIREKKTIGFLPGTRDDAYKNIEAFYMIAGQIKRLDKSIDLIMSLPANLDKTILNKIRTQTKIPSTENFNEVLGSSDLIIGLSGTGNEQAAGSGIPVIAFPGRGAQFNPRFAAGQKELLGNALLLLPRDPWIVAKEAISLVRDRKRIKRMSTAGKKRMGRPGATAKIAKMILKELGR
jgi:hypothetical protein